MDSSPVTEPFTPGPIQQVDRLVRRATRAMDAGDIGPGAELAQQAVDLSRRECPGAARERVLALLCLLRTQPAEAVEMLAEAHAVADESDEPQLVTAIAHAARTLGLPLPTHVF
jgi:hypothetical protein